MLQKSPVKKILVPVIIAFLLVLGSISRADAVTVTWSGGGGDESASNSANWAGNITPQTGDDVIFDITSGKDCTWNLNVTLASLIINPSYSGILTLNADLSVTGDVNIWGGSLILNNNNLVVGSTSPSSPPTVTTDAATNINGNAATLNASTNPNSAETTVYFEWGTDTSYGNSTVIQSVGSGADNVAVSDSVTGLSTNSTYHYRVVATNTYGTRYGDDVSFTTGGGTTVSGTISTDTTWTYAGSPYIITGNIFVYGASEPTLTIEPGVEVRVNGYYYLNIGYSSLKGRLVAQGTAGSPIVFTSNKATPAPGDWYGIRFYNHASSESLLEYVTVEYGGYGGMGNIYMSSSSPGISNSVIQHSSSYGVYLTGNSAPVIVDSVISDNASYGFNITGSSSPAITVSTVSNNGSSGVYMANTAFSTTIANTTFTSNGTYALDMAATASLGTGNTFTNETGIKIRGGTITDDITWRYTGIPYIVSGHIYVYGASEPTLTIEPGVEVRFNGYYYLNIGYSSLKGRLEAQGTAGSPIVFTSNKATPAPGDWYGIRFYNHASSESILEYVTVEYGGYGGMGNIYMSSSSPGISNSVIQHSSSYGIYVTGNSAPVLVSSSIVLNNTHGVYAIGNGSLNIIFSDITANNQYAVYSTISQLNVNHCNITGNSSGIYSSTGKVADVRYNWWGDGSGPSGEGPGSGQSVSTGVIFEPWLDSVYSYPFHNKKLSATIQEFSPSDNSVDYSFEISENSDWTFEIIDSIDNLVRSFSGTGTFGSVTWDGKDGNQLTVPDGTYTYKLHSTSISSGFQSAPFSGDVVVGGDLPKAVITYPADGQYLGNISLEIQGMASDSADFNSYKVEYGAGTSPTSWTFVTSSTTPVDTEGVLATMNLSSLHGAYYTIRLSVTDQASNSAVAEVGIYKGFIIDNVSVSNQYFSPDGDGIKDTTMISAEISYQSDWTLEIKNSVDTVIKSYAGTGTSISVTWDGADTTGTVQLEGEYSFTINAVESISGDTAIASGTVTIIFSPPSVSTDPASSVTETSATLNATVNPNASDTTVYFEWGTDTSYGNSTTVQSIGDGSDNVSLSEDIQSLAAGSVYYYRAVANNTYGVSYGDDLSFTASDGLSGGTMQINAIVDGSPWSGSVDYMLSGPEAINGTKVPHNYSGRTIGAYTLSYISGGPAGALLNSITPSNIQTLPLYGTITYTMSFLFPPAAPSDLAADAVSSSKVGLSWSDNANNETGFRIERKADSEGTYAEITTVGANVTTYTDSGLSPGTTYYYRVRAHNSSINSGYTNESSITVETIGTIQVNATLDGSAWSGSLDYTINGPETIGNSSVPAVYNGRLTGEYTITHNSGGPALSELDSITPSSTQTLQTDGTITFTLEFTSGIPPAAKTEPATNLNGNFATLNGIVNPNGDDTTIYFEWGVDTAYGDSTPSQSVGNGTTDIFVSENLSGISTTTTYHYRVVATNSYGTNYGDDMNFTTPVEVSTGILQVNSTVDGSPWAGSADYTINGPEIISGSSVPSTFNGHLTGNYTIVFTSGGPAISALSGITPSSAQTLQVDGTITFTLEFTSHIPPAATTDPASNLNGNFATLNGTVNPNGDDTTIYFEWGTDTAYGNSTPPQAIGNGTDGISVSENLTGLSSGTTYHYRVVATNVYGTIYGDDVHFTTPPVTLSITYPVDGDMIYGPDVMVSGTANNMTAKETGVTVNGKVAVVYNGEFFINHFPLQEGQNIIKADAVDIDGNMATSSITVNADTLAPHVTLRADMESGTSPLKTYFSISTEMPDTVTTYEMDYDGNGINDFTGAEFENINYLYALENIYFPTVTVTDSSGNNYSDRIAILVLPWADTHRLLKSKWEAMKTALANQDVQGALDYFIDESRSYYNDVFTALYDQLPQMVQDMQDIWLVNIKENTAKFRFKQDELQGGQTVTSTYHIYFVRDTDGIWKIYRY